MCSALLRLLQEGRPESSCWATEPLRFIPPEGSWPIESPNIEFQPDAEGGQSLVGTIDQSSATLSWLALETTGTAFISVTDLDGNVLDECGVEVVSTSVSGDLGAPAVDGSGAIVAGDGTGIVDVDRLIVLRAIANPTGFSGDAGGPEANSLITGFQPKWTKAMPLRMLTPKIRVR